MIVYITFSPYGERQVLYVGTDKEAALDAKQMVDDRCYQQTLTVLAKGELRDDFSFDLGSVVTPRTEEVVAVRDGTPVTVDRVTF